MLQKFDDHGDVTTVYVTDYTVNTLVHTVETTWCPPRLSDRVLQCNMWDNARNIAKMMNPGEYWYLHNVRARWNPNHYMEGTIQLAEKVTQLDETKLEVQPYLRALLALVYCSILLEQTDASCRRKKEFGLNNSGLTSGSASLHIFPEMLFQDVEESTNFLTCIVEVLFHFPCNYSHAHHIPGSCSTSTSTHGTDIFYMSPTIPTILTCRPPPQQPVGRIISNIVW